MSIGSSAILAAVLIGLASSIALVPVQRIRQWMTKKGFMRSETTKLDEQLSPQDTLARAHISKVMSSYLHEIGARDHIKLLAAAHNLHPLNIEDVLTQVIYMRRDMNRINRIIEQEKIYSTRQYLARDTFQSDFMVSFDEIRPSSNVNITHFTQNMSVPGAGISNKPPRARRTLGRRSFA